MLGGRVLLHYVGERYLTLRPQKEHTLSTWSIRQLVRQTRLRSFKVRRRPEFWRPEQRRPRGVLVFPVGKGVAAISRERRFQPRERRAVRTVLRFLEARRPDSVASTPVSASARRPSPVRKPSLAGEGLIGGSRTWKRVLTQVGKVAHASCPVVLLGETGTGKERLARALHSSSPRSQGPFVPVNCGAIAPDVMASELFGHIKGAFTGAHRNREGFIARAHRGTLFLDEVADMPPPMQVALLRVLEDRKVTPVGSTRPRTVDVRVVSATHGDLSAEVDMGTFREDLYHRLNVISIHLPPLRDRNGDLLLLAEHLLAKTEEPKCLHPDAVSVLKRHDWPGNVRELDNVLRAASLLEDGPEVTPETLASILQSRRARAPRQGQKSSPLGPRSHELLRALGDRWLSSTQLAERVGVSHRTVNRDLEHLLGMGLIETHGRARARVYRRVALS
jgi:DNA-binding NtrC family response regulator